MEKPLVFVTGGTGFLGHHLIPELLSSGYRVRVLVRENSDVSWLKPLNVEFHSGDVTIAHSLVSGVVGCEFIVHAAGFFRFWGNEKEFFKVNVEGLENLLNAALRARIQKFIHISTIAVIGKPYSGEVLDEKAICNPQDGYQKAKFAAENVLRYFRIPYVILRPGAFYGPFGRYGFNRLFVEDPMRGVRVMVEHGERLIFPVYVPDVAKSIVSALSEGVPGDVYNITDDPISHKEINQIVSDLLGISHWRLNTPKWLMITLAMIMEGFAKISRKEPFYPINLRHYVFNDWNVSNTKAKEVLCFKPTPITIGLSETVNWYMERSTRE